MPSKKLPAWHCWRYHAKIPLTSLISSPIPQNTIKHAALFIGGLSDSPGSVLYTYRLQKRLAEHVPECPLVMPQLPSSAGGWGMSSLEEDVEFLRMVMDSTEQTFNEGKRISWILIGHSTGCQDIMKFLTSYDDDAAAYVSNNRVKGAILQAPVSDRESRDQRDYTNMEAYCQADRLCAKGPSEFFIKGPPVPTRSSIGGDSFKDRIGHGILNPPVTAYRYTSLYRPLGDDDFFSSDTAEDIVHIFAAAALRAKLCFISSGAE